MSVREVDVVDRMGVDIRKRALVLQISDPYAWDVQPYHHLNAMMEKIKNYVRFIRNKDYSESYGDQPFEAYRIEIAARYECIEDCYKMIASANENLAKEHISIQYIVKGDKK